MPYSYFILKLLLLWWCCSTYYAMGFGLGWPHFLAQLIVISLGDRVINVSWTEAKVCHHMHVPFALNVMKLSNLKWRQRLASRMQQRTSPHLQPLLATNVTLTQSLPNRNEDPSVCAWNGKHITGTCPEYFSFLFLPIDALVNPFPPLKVPDFNCDHDHGFFSCFLGTMKKDAYVECQNI